MKKDMKTWTLTLVLMLGSAALVAQDSRLSSKEDAQGGVYRTTIHSGEFYAKLTSFVLANHEQVRFTADDIMLRMTRDQDFLKALQELRDYRFENLIQALNVCASHGWEVRSSSVIEGRSGPEQHFLLARPVDSMMPVSPWLEPRPLDAKGSRQR